jgi:hypothetical protein
MADAHKNFAYTTVSTAPSPATSGTSLVVADGTVFPAVPFNATVWPVNAQPTSANAEIVRVTNIATNTLTITRATELSVARSIIVTDQISATITAKTLTDVETQVLSDSGTNSAPAHSFSADPDTGAYREAANTYSLATAGVKALGIDSTQFIDSPTQPRCVAYNNGTQSLNNGTVTTITFDSEDVDTASMHSTVSNTSRITIPTGGDGFYLVFGRVSFTENATGNRISIIKLNATTDLSRGQFTGGSTITSGLHTAPVMWAGILVAGDFLELQGFQDTGGALSTGSATRSYSSFLSVIKLW